MEIKLVLPKIEHAEFWLKLRSQTSTQKYNPVGILNLQQIQEQIAISNKPISEKKNVHRFYIESAGSWVGVISIKDINWESGIAEIGYLIDESVHGQGIATQAVRMILGIAFTEAKLNKIKAATVVENIGSYRALEKNGFKKEGLLRKEYLVQGKLHDVYMWSILREEYLGN